MRLPLDASRPCFCQKAYLSIIGILLRRSWVCTADLQFWIFYPRLYMGSWPKWIEFLHSRGRSLSIDCCCFSIFVAMPKNSLTTFDSRSEQLRNLSDPYVRCAGIVCCICSFRQSSARRSHTFYAGDCDGGRHWLGCFRSLCKAHEPPHQASNRSGQGFSGSRCS